MNDQNRAVHNDPHFDHNGLCVCACRNCTGLKWFCLCMDCPCESDDEHHVASLN